jgi:hypothetical protein
MAGRILFEVRKGHCMLWNLGAGWLLLAIAIVGILSFIVSMALNAVMGEDGFGAVGNAIIITTGFFLTVFMANNFGYRLADVTMAVSVGLGGAFACLATLAVLKAGINRL